MFYSLYHKIVIQLTRIASNYAFFTPPGVRGRLRSVLVKISEKAKSLGLRMVSRLFEDKGENKSQLEIATVSIQGRMSHMCIARTPRSTEQVLLHLNVIIRRPSPSHKRRKTPNVRVFCRLPRVDATPYR